MWMSEFRIIPRSEWGARYRDGFGTRSLPCRYGFFHHSVTSSDGVNATLAQDYAKIRIVESVGYSRFGGISYTYMITESGRIFQGHSDNRIGAHTAGFNTTGVAISFIGNYENLKLNDKQVAAAVWLIKNLVSRGVAKSDAFWRGHYQVASTACQGKNAKARQLEIITKAKQPTPAPTPVPKPPVEVPMTYEAILIHADSATAEKYKKQAAADGKLAVSQRVNPLSGDTVAKRTEQMQFALSGAVNRIESPTTYRAVVVESKSRGELDAIEALCNKPPKVAYSRLGRSLVFHAPIEKTKEIEALVALYGSSFVVRSHGIFVERGTHVPLNQTPPLGVFSPDEVFDE